MIRLTTAMYRSRSPSRVIAADAPLALTGGGQTKTYYCRHLAITDLVLLPEVVGGATGAERDLRLHRTSIPEGLEL